MSVFYVAVGLPALVSTGITIFYFFLKACSYIFHAIPHKTERRVATATTSGGKQKHSQIREKKAMQKFVNKYRDIFQRMDSMVEGQSDLQGPYFYQEGGKTYASLPLGMIQGIQQSPLFNKMKKDCKAEGIKLPKDIMAKDPRTHLLTPQEYLKNVEARIMPPMNNHNVLKEMAKKAAANDQTHFVMMEFRDFKRPSPPKMPRPQKRR